MGEPENQRDSLPEWSTEKATYTEQTVKSLTCDVFRALVDITCRWGRKKSAARNLPKNYHQNFQISPPLFFKFQETIKTKTPRSKNPHLKRRLRKVDLPTATAVEAISAGEVVERCVGLHLGRGIIPVTLQARYKTQQGWGLNKMPGF